MTTINPYLMFDGTCEKAFQFYHSVFGGETPMYNKFGEMPPQEGMPPLSEEGKNRIMHVSLPISAETILMGSDIMPGMEGFERGDGFQLSLGVNSREEALDLFTKLSENGKVTMPLEDTFWGAYFGMWTDQFGVDWMVNFDDPARIQSH